MSHKKRRSRRSRTNCSGTAPQSTADQAQPLRGPRLSELNGYHRMVAQQKASYRRHRRCKLIRLPHYLDAVIEGFEAFRKLVKRQRWLISSLLLR